MSLETEILIESFLASLQLSCFYGCLTEKKTIIRMTMTMRFFYTKFNIMHNR